jgi:dihydrofolate reductase
LAVVLYFSISLDGYVAGQDVGKEHPMGVGGEALHDWMFAGPQEADRAFIERSRTTAGAVVVGRRTFDLGLEHWNDTPYPAPTFVITHRAHAPLPQKSGTFTFVTDGVESAVKKATAAAGGKEVIVMGGETARQVLALGLADRLELQLAPILLHAGVKLFDGLAEANLVFIPRGAPVTTTVTHLTYDCIGRRSLGGMGQYFRGSAVEQL